MSFIITYLTVTLIVIPPLAKFNGRVPLPNLKTQNLIPHNYLTPLLNRHYVKPKLRDQLIESANDIHNSNNELKISYLDANFPFIDGFPLLPHLSHHDGRKVDLSFYYTQNSKEGNLKPSNSGYGIFAQAKKGETNQTQICHAKGYWQYDFTKFLTFGSRKDLSFDSKNTKALIKLIINNPRTQKLFIEPHLKKRMDLNHDKIRFHGCQAVRHDDHIHFQIYR